MSSELAPLCKDVAEEDEVVRPLIQALTKQAENLVCFQCGTGAPRWVDVNLGLFLCIECSGFHRSLGVHISMVRSLNLDRFTVKNLVALQLGGNSRANRTLVPTIDSYFPSFKRLLSFELLPVKDPAQRKELATRGQAARNFFSSVAVNEYRTALGKKIQEVMALYSALRLGNLFTLQNAIGAVDFSVTGSFALHLAVKKNSRACVELLLKHKPNFDDEFKGKTALEMANDDHLLEMASILSSAGATVAKKPVVSAPDPFPFVENLGSGSSKAAGFTSTLSPSQISTSAPSSSSSSLASSEFVEEPSLDTTVESASSVSSFFSPNDDSDAITAPSSSALAERLKLLKPLALKHIEGANTGHFGFFPPPGVNTVIQPHYDIELDYLLSTVESASATAVTPHSTMENVAQGGGNSSQPEADSFAFGQTARASNYGPSGTTQQQYSKPPQTMMEVLMSYAQVIPQYIPTKEQLKDYKDKITVENAKAVAKSGVELAKVGGHVAMKSAKAFYTGSVEADKASSKAGAAPNLFGYSGAAPVPATPPPTTQLFSNSNYSARSFSSNDFPNQNQGYHNPFSSPNTTQPNPSQVRPNPGYSSHSPSSRPGPSMGTPTPASNFDIVEDEMDPEAESEAPAQEEAKPVPKEQPKPAAPPPSNLSANYSFISQLNSPSKPAASAPTPASPTAPSPAAGTGDVWAMLAQLSKK